MLTVPGFRIYFAGSISSNLGIWLQITAQILLAYQLTHSAFAVGLIACAQFSSFLLLGPWAGILVLRLGGARVLIGAQLFSAAVAGAMAGLEFSGTLNEPKLLIGALGSGLAFTFAVPSQTAIAPRLVPETEARDAVAMNSLSYNLGRTLAPILCVTILVSIGPAWPFALNTMSCLYFAAIVAVLRPRITVSAMRRGYNRIDLRIARQPRILLLLAMVAAASIADNPVLVLGSSLSNEVLSISSVWSGYFLSALGLGVVLGTLVPSRSPTTRQAAMALLFLALSMLVFTSGISSWVSLVAAVAAGITGLQTGAATQVLVLRSAGSRQAAQILTLWVIASIGIRPIVSLLDGWLANYVGVVNTGIILTSPALTVALLELFLPVAVKNRLKKRIREIYDPSHAHIQ